MVGAEVHRALGRALVGRPRQLQTFGDPRLGGEAAGDDPDVDQLVRRVGLVAESLQVFPVVSLSQVNQGLPGDSLRGHGYRQLGDLPHIFHVHLSGDFLSRTVETLNVELAAPLVPKTLHDTGELGQVQLLEGLEVGLDEVVFHVGNQQTEGAEHPGERRHHQPAYVKHIGQPGGVDWATATEGEQDEPARVPASFAGHRAKGASHVGVDQQVYTVGRVHLG